MLKFVHPLQKHVRTVDGSPSKNACTAYVN